MDQSQVTPNVLPRLTSLNQVVIDLIDLYQPAFASKRLGSGLALDPVLPLTWIDAPQIALALANLLRNALRTSREGDLIVCRTASDGDWAELTIGESWTSTAGAPVNADLTAEADAGPAGLDAAAAIISAHGGAIELNPAGHSGAAFVVRLPAIVQEHARLLEELEQSQQLQYHLITTLSAELRNPLNVIIGYNDLLLDGTLGRLGDEQIDTLHRIDQNAKTLLDQINHALNLGRITPGRHGGLSHPAQAAGAESAATADSVTQWLAVENARLHTMLEQSRQLQREFITTMSHRLRTPLNAIIGYDDLLLEEAFGALTTEQAGVLRRSRRSALALLDAVNTNLDADRRLS